MNTKRARGSGLAIELGEEARTLLARRGNRGSLQKGAEKFRMFVGPAL